MVEADPQSQSEYQKLQNLAANGTLTDEMKACFGCILGAFIGDSLGSFREFKHGDCPDDIIR